MSLKFQVTGPPLLDGAPAAVARFGAGFLAAAFFGAAFFAAFLAACLAGFLAVFFATFFFAAFIPLSMPKKSDAALALFVGLCEMLLADSWGGSERAKPRPPAGRAVLSAATSGSVTLTTRECARAARPRLPRPASARSAWRASARRRWSGPGRALRRSPAQAPAREPPRRAPRAPTCASR